MEIKVLEVPIPEETSIIVGQSHFIKSVEDIYESLITSCPSIKFGLAFCEASGKRLIRHEGNHEDLINLAINACKTISVGHVFVIYIKESWPINVLNSLKGVQEIVSLYVATSNPLKVIVADLGESAALLGVSDGFKPLGVEADDDKVERKELLRKFRYKL
ncbi:MAG: adenosine-specific kinase [Caldisphaeraceae archaeon]|nr:adenosine-specific kinase [Caldisphaeraceae archaeon]